MEGEERRGWTDDLREFFQFAWRYFGVKLGVTLTFTSGLIALLVTLISPMLSPETTAQLRLVLIGTVVTLAALTVVLGVLGVIREIKQVRRRAQEAWDQVDALQLEKDALLDEGASQRLAHITNAALYGFVYYRRNVVCTLQDNGGMIVEHTADLAATQPGVHGVESFSWVPITSEEGRQITLDAPTIARGREEYRVEFSAEVVSHENGGLVKRFQITPDLPLGQRYRYEWKETWPEGAFSMTLDAMENADLDWEYYYHQITYPTERLDLRMLLPLGFKPVTTACDVWYARHTYIRHVREHTRLVNDGVKDRWVDGRLRLRIDVREPLLGLIYVLKWKPPTVWSPVEG